MPKQIKTSQDIKERKTTEEKLRETTDYLESLFNYANAPIIVWDTKFRITRFNHAFERLTGKSADKVIGEKLNILFPRDMMKEAMGHIRKTLKGEQWEVVEIPILHTNRTVKTVLWNSANIYSPDGKRITSTIAHGQDITERKKTREKLSETSDYLENLFNYANAPIIVWNTKFRITRFNHAFERLTGKSAKKVIGKKLDILFPHDKSKEAMTHIRRTLKGEKWEVVEIPILCKGKKVSNLLWNSATIYAKDSKTVIAIIAQGQDITSRRRAEEKLQKTTNYLENLLNYANAPIIVWDTEFKITRFNHASERLAGWKAKEVIGKKLHILFPQTSRKESLNKITRTLAGEYWKSVDIPILRKDGNIKLVLWNSANILDKDTDKIIATIAQGQDITERKKAQEGLIESEIKYKELVENANSLILKVDTKGRITFLNEFAEKFFGYKKEKIIGKNVIGIIMPKKLSYLAKEVCRNPEKYSKHEHINMTKDGREVFISWTNKPIYEKGKCIGVIRIGNDITYRKELEKELENKVKARTKELDTTNKELKTKLDELERFHNLVIGREMKMIELKKHIKKLEKEEKKKNSS